MWSQVGFRKHHYEQSCCCCCCCKVASVMSDSVRSHRQQPTRLPRLWDSPGKNTGVDCHFLLQCMKVKSESEVAQLCLTLHDPTDCSLPGSSDHGIFQARVLEWGAIAFSDEQSQWRSIEFQLSYLKSWKMILWKCYTLYASKFGKLSSGHRTGKGQFSFQSQREEMPKNAQTSGQFHSSHMLVKWCLKFSKPGFSNMWTVNFQMFKLFLEKAGEQEIKLPTSTGS